MSNRPNFTGYARLTPPQARVVLAALALTAAICVAIALSPLARSQVGKKSPGAGDLALYWAEVGRMRAGQGYYEAAAAELTSRGYPTRSVFNWRTPLPMWLLGRLPHPWLGKAILGFLAASLMMLSFEAVWREDRGSFRQFDGSLRQSGNDSPRPPTNLRSVPGEGQGVRALGCAALLIGPLVFCVLDDLFVAPCLWCGVWIGLSLCAYGLDRPGWGVAAGVAALFFRELALPYCLLSLGLACCHRQWKEAAAWMLGMLAWLGFFGLHWMEVAQFISPDARAHQHGWVQFGGAAFVIAVTQMNAYLLVLPHWVSAVYFVAAMLGLAGWNTPFGQRVGLTAAVFVAAFGVVGQDFNQYWGSVVAPLWCFGVARFPASLAELWRAARGGVGVRGSGFRVQGSGFRGQG